MKKLSLTSIVLLISIYCCAQTINPNRKFSAEQLKTDLYFLKSTLFNAHANPFSELSKADYEKVFAGIDARITDSMTATAFYKVVRPAVAYLSDEHAQININPNLQTDEYKNGNTFFPLSLSRKGNAYVVEELFGANTLQKGEIITQVNGQPIAQLVTDCAAYSTGFPDQRIGKALEQFGYLYTISHPGSNHTFDIRTADGKQVKLQGTNLKTWTDYVVAKAGQSGSTGKSISYNRYGNAGYITATAFDARNDRQMDSLKKVVAGMFGQMKADGVKTLFIDVSRNGGGNSAVGDMIIDFFYDKPYRGYQCNWRRSDEYLALMKSWGNNDQYYTSQPLGKVIHFDSDESKPSGDNPLRFNGKVYVLVGDGTFSSAIMFATTIKDNHIATLIGKAPKDGHPNHFGELYATKLPNTKLDVRFGVKEWIRPAGKTGENVLRPDLIVDVNQSPGEVVKSVLK
ncbi:MAG: S41 family peptidase [Bacteroidota bacterium]